MQAEHKIVAVVAIGKNRELGLGDKLLWHIPDDLKRFRMLTRGHPIIMGRKTFESILSYRGKPLPDRTNIVITRDQNYDKTLTERGFKGVLVAGNVEEAIWLAKRQPGADEIHIGGGAQIYEQALPHIDKLCLTLIEDSKPADTFFPDYTPFFKKKVFEESHEHDGLKYTWVDLER
nr:Dihydrofolate reductase [uncultured bacterium]